MQVVFAPAVLHALGRYAWWPGDRKVKPVLPPDGEEKEFETLDLRRR